MLILVNAQPKRAPELKPCLTTEFAFVIHGFANSDKSYDENSEVGQRIDYIISEFY